MLQFKKCHVAFGLFQESVIWCLYWIKYESYFSVLMIHETWELFFCHFFLSRWWFILEVSLISPKMWWFFLSSRPPLTFCFHTFKASSVLRFASQPDCPWFWRCGAGLALSVCKSLSCSPLTRPALSLQWMLVHARLSVTFSLAQLRGKCLSATLINTKQMAAGSKYAAWAFPVMKRASMKYKAIELPWSHPRVQTVGLE